MFGKISEPHLPHWPCCGKSERRLHHRADLVGEEAGVLVEALEFLAVALGQFGLVVPRVDLARSAVDEQPDDRAGLGIHVTRHAVRADFADRSCGPTARPRSPCSCSRPASASVPKPLPARAKKSRREANAGPGGAKKRGRDFMSRSSSPFNRCRRTHSDTTAPGRSPARPVPGHSTSAAASCWLNWPVTNAAESFNSSASGSRPRAIR